MQQISLAMQLVLFSLQPAFHSTTTILFVCPNTIVFRCLALNYYTFSIYIIIIITFIYVYFCAGESGTKTNLLS